MRIGLYYSTITGNTKKLAKYLEQGLQADGYDVSLYNIKDVMQVEAFDIYIVAFWCRRSSMDDLSLRLVDKLKRQKVLAVGTIGGKADEDYGRRVEKMVYDVIDKENICLGTYACQGMIDPKRTEKRRMLPKDAPHYLDDAGYARHLANWGRPHEEDMQRVLHYVELQLKKK